MMVTFVSQCEKKALPKTRRVLDAFANRIGSRTWQTVITLDGLDAVRKLLRKTASKNTAVSCHWIRSRSRSELVWIVGNNDEFNSQGVVPVNYTNTTQLMIDEIRVMTDKIHANTAQQPLDQHLFAVGYLAAKLSRNFAASDDQEKQALANFVSGVLHDIGKIDPVFQEWVQKAGSKKIVPEIPEEGQHIESGKFSFENHPRHNEISLLLYHLLGDDSYKKINSANKRQIKHAIYWHHAKPIRKNEFKRLDVVYAKLKKNIGDGPFTEVLHTTAQVIASVNQLSETYHDGDPLLVKGILTHPDDERLDDLSRTELPLYKIYSEANDDVSDYRKSIIENSHGNLARATIISADRLVSGLSKETLLDHIEQKTLGTLLEDALLDGSTLSQEISECIKGFENKHPNSERNQQQRIAANELDEISGIAVLNGPAGCGKTKIALEWAARSGAKKIIWICPRVQVCQGLLNDLQQENYLPATKIEINTGEFKAIHKNGKTTETPEGQEFSGDIILTTIDQVINTISTHSKVTGLIQYLNAHIVFDEYHEYINMAAFNLLFAELVECKKHQENGRALLVSATPNYYFLEELLDVNRDNIVSVASFNRSSYRISYESFDEGLVDDSNPLYKPQPDNTFVISNTAITAQSSFIKNQKSEKALLFHSKYTKTDKQDLFDKVIENFNEEGAHSFNVLRSGPVIQASLNISCDYMVTEFTSAENWLQRLGRLDRFGNNTNINEYITAIPDSLVAGKQSGKCARFLNSLFILQGAKAWHVFLLNQIGDKTESITLHELYEAYRDFYDDEQCRSAVEEDLKRALKRSTDVINNKLYDPVSIPRKKVLANSNVKIKKHSLRGDNRFVQMAICHFSETGELSYPEEYAYDESDLDANLTTSVDLVCGYGDSSKNLLSFMAKKHHNIKSTKKAYNDNVLLNESRSPETPIYLSYTPSDLEAVGGTSASHPYAIYYATCSSQPIGLVSISKFNNQST